MSIFYRKYNSYEDYLKHQSLKMEIGLNKKVKKLLPEYFKNQVKSFEERIKKFKNEIKGEKVICLGARTGAEVAAFRNLGFVDSIGIDLNPGPDNKYVIKGDFHNIEFDDNSFDIVYCNCIDHAWGLDKLSMEIRRILKNNGYLVLEIDHLLKKSKKDRKELIKKKSKYESVMWSNFEDIKKEFNKFELIKSFEGAYDIFLVAIFRNIK